MDMPCTQLAPTPRHTRQRPFTVSLARSDEEITQCQRLRYRVFVEEMGAKTNSRVPGLDRDRFDAYCKHIVVRNSDTGAVVATTRLLLDYDAMEAGKFYSETEFDLSPVLSLNGRMMEVGRTCIHPAYRKGSVLAMMWHGVARMMDLHNVDYVIGCASIPMANGEGYVRSVVDYLRSRHMSIPQLRVRPLTPLPRIDVAAPGEISIPTLLKGYLRQGAVICGEPHHDASFNVADVFVLLDRDHLARRYRRHFMNRA